MGALKCGVLGNQSERESAGRRDVLAGGCHGDEVFLGREQAMVQPMMVQPMIDAPTPTPQGKKKKWRFILY